MFKPRQYQIEAIDSAVQFFRGEEKINAFEILPTGSGKSVVIANIAKELTSDTLVLQPSKEILEQNYHKYTSYGFRAGIYSASAGSKRIEKVTFATIGSIVKKKHLFKNIKNIIVDECHLVNPEDGMYRDFFAYLPAAKILGLTATPYRLISGFEGAQLVFLNRTSPRTFTKLIYYVQNNVLFDAGHLAKLEYFDFNVVDRTKLKTTANGADFTEASLREYYREINMPKLTADKAFSILKVKRNTLIFCSLISEANEVKKMLALKGIHSEVLTGETETAERERILSQFKSGKIRCVVNVGVLTTGFDYPALESVLIARSTMSLALYYQIVGRAMRPYTYTNGFKKVAWICDLGGNIRFFGKIETMQIKCNARGEYSIWNNNKQLTNIAFTKN
jgi:DNA repair protein RadD